MSESRRLSSDHLPSPGFTPTELRETPLLLGSPGTQDYLEVRPGEASPSHCFFRWRPQVAGVAALTKCCCTANSFTHPPLTPAGGRAPGPRGRQRLPTRCHHVPNPPPLLETFLRRLAPRGVCTRRPGRVTSPGSPTELRNTSLLPGPQGTPGQRRSGANTVQLRHQVFHTF